MTGKSGLDKHLGDHGTGVEKPAAAQQISFLGQDPAESSVDGARGGNSGEIVETAKTGKAGRPKGAVNRSTGDMVRYLNTFGSGPLVGMAKVVNMVTDKGLPDVVAIGLAFTMDRADALDFWFKCAKELAPYMHQKMPIALKVDAGADLDLVVVNPNDIVGGVPSDEMGLIGRIYGEVVDVINDDENGEGNQ